MKSNSIAGLAFALYPDDSYDQATVAQVKNTTDDKIISGNNFYLFEGTMPPATDLQKHTDVTAFLALYGPKQILKIENMDLKYTYDKNTRTRTIEKSPVDALSFTSAVTGTAKWGMLELVSKNLAIGDKLMLFTDAVGAWEDADQAILVSNTAVVTGENITVKSINITIQDAMIWPGELS